jgi:predicted GNAT family acetyltransferase
METAMTAKALCGQATRFGSGTRRRPGLSETVSITHDDQGSHGAYHATVAGEAAEGLLTWREASPGVVVADHTLVPTAIGGRGVAARLVEALIADARQREWKIVPACSYVAAQFRRHPEWADLQA